LSFSNNTQTKYSDIDIAYMKKRLNQSKVKSGDSTPGCYFFKAFFIFYFIKK